MRCWLLPPSLPPLAPGTRRRSCFSRTAAPLLLLTISLAILARDAAEARQLDKQSLKDLAGSRFNLFVNFHSPR